MADSIADPTTITNEQLAGKVVESVKAVQDAELTVVAEGKKLVAHMADPNAHGQDVGACITQAIADHEGNADAHGLEAFKTGLTGTVDTKLGDLRTELSAKLEGLNEPTLVRTDDIRLSDARPPLTHDHDAAYAAKTHQHSPNDLNAVVPLAKGGTGNTTGNAVTATQLQTPRTISLSGGVTGTATSFNGSANVTIPVTGLDISKANAGTLPLARGGTARTDGKAVALATARTISLTGGVTGSAGFDGSANVSIAATLATASTAAAGVVKLNTAVNSTSQTEAATPSAVKQAYDLAASAPLKPMGNTTFIRIDAGSDGGTITLPVGGSWAVFIMGVRVRGGAQDFVIAFGSNSDPNLWIGVYPGGKTLTSTARLAGFAWRIA